MRRADVRWCQCGIGFDLLAGRDAAVYIENLAGDEVRCRRAEDDPCACSGFQYGFTFDEVTNEDDTALVKDSVTLLIDPMSYQYLVGAEIDYQDGLEGAQFVIKNPNATTARGCGSSFSA